MDQIRKRGNPSFVKNGPSPNPTGRPKGAAGLAAYIALQTDNGKELVDRLLTISRDLEAPLRESAGATYALLDRMAGKPMQPSEIQMQLDQTTRFELPHDWQTLTPPQRTSYLLQQRQLRLSSGDPK